MLRGHRYASYLDRNKRATEAIVNPNSASLQICTNNKKGKHIGEKNSGHATFNIM
jgi:hypothetical protein